MAAYAHQKASDEDQKNLEQLARKYEAVYNRQDAAGVAALYAEDAIEIRPQGVMQGRAAVQKEYERQFKADCRDLAITINKDVRTSGDIEWSTGEWTVKCGGNPGHGYWSHVATRGSDTHIQQNTVVILQ
jgi:ketosteroid isomerase-like protein